MSEDRRCCNCRHDIRTGEQPNIQNFCDIDGHIIGYVECMTGWCQRWQKKQSGTGRINDMFVRLKNAEDGRDVFFNASQVKYVLDAAPAEGFSAIFLSTDPEQAVLVTGKAKDIVDMLEEEAKW